MTTAGWGASVLLISIAGLGPPAKPPVVPIWAIAGEGRGTPAVSESRVYFLTARHEIVAADRATGAVVWRRLTGEPGGETLGSSVLIRGSTVIAGDHAVLGFDSGTGERRWRFSPADDSGAGAYLGDLADGQVFVGSRAGRLYAVEASTGIRAWSVQVSDSPGTTVFQPVADAELVTAGYTTFANPPLGGVVAVERGSGRVRWRRPLATVDAASGGFGGGPVITPGAVWVAGADGWVRALARGTGEVLAALPGVTRPDGRAQDRDWRALALGGSTLIAGSLSGIVAGFDMEARRERWRTALHDGGSVALRLTANDETVYVPHLGGRLVALSVADGHQRWEMGGLSDGCSWAPAVVGSTAYVSARAGLFAVPR